MFVSTQDYAEKIIRNAAVLTNSYVAGTVLDGPSGNGCHLMNQLVLYIQFTKGSLTSASIKVEFSNDLQTWYQETFESVSGGGGTDSVGTHIFSDANANYRLLLNIKDRYIRVSAIGTGTVTGSSMAILGIYGIL